MAITCEEVSSERLRLWLEQLKLPLHDYHYIKETSQENLAKTVQTCLWTQNQIMHSLNQVIDHLLETLPEVKSHMLMLEAEK